MTVSEQKPVASEKDQDSIGGVSNTDSVTFASLGLVPALCESCDRLGFKKPTPIQTESIPLALKKRDVIGLAQTGSGKTAAFVLPLLQALLEDPQPFFGLILAPTRELAIQIAEQAEALGADIGVKCAVIVGGMDQIAQSIALSRKPHIVVGTPGRLVDHLEHTRGFSMPKLRYLILDEADRLLNMDFGPAIDKILAAVPRQGRRTMLFSATMTGKVAKLQRACLTDPARVEISANRYATVDTLLQYYALLPAKLRDAHLFYLLTEMSGSTMIVFVATCASAQRLACASRHLGFSAIPLHGKMTQQHRLAALNRFKAGQRSILFATDVAARGLDIPSVDVVINYDVPANSKDYVHRVGRTARAGRSGKSICFVTQYDVELYQRIEQLIGKKLPAYPIDREGVALLQTRSQEAMRLAMQEIRAEEERQQQQDRSDKRGKSKKNSWSVDTDARTEYFD